MKKLLFLLALTACAHGQIRAPVRAATSNAKLVASVWVNPSPDRWRQSGWWRQNEDAITPSRVVISTDWFACIMDNDVNEPRPREYYVCPGAWRHKRGF